MPTFAYFLVLLLAVGLAVGGYRVGRRRYAHRRRERREDVVKLLHHRDAAGRATAVSDVGAALNLRRDHAERLLGRLAADGLLARDGESLRLLPPGHELAHHLVRAHRLWEQHLAQNTGHAATDWHTLADAAEHQLTPQAADALASRLGHPVFDPHGDPIPPAGRPPRPQPAVSVATLSRGAAGRIVHVEDEPPARYAELAAAGITPGLNVAVEAIDDDAVRLRVGSTVTVLSVAAATQIHVVPLPDDTALNGDRRLDALRPGDSGVIRALLPACRGVQRRRLLDLGLVPGTRIAVAFASPGGDPVAYQVRDTLIALRRDQAQHILIAPEAILS